MTKLDQFESVFRAAEKVRFEYDPPDFGSVLLVSDADAVEREELLAQVRALLPELDASSEWSSAEADEIRSVRAMLQFVEARSPDLIVTYRNLFSDAWHWPYSLGEHLDVLTQVVKAPVLVLPHPQAGRAFDHSMQDLDRVMAMTGHMTGDHALVNHAAALTASGGHLRLVHVEDDAEFERFMTVISKLPAIETDEARAAIEAQLLKEPSEFMDTCSEALAAAGVELTIEKDVVRGHRVAECKRLISENEVDLLVLPTKDEDQLAMHGLAYPLAVELRGLPLLLI